VCTQLHVQLLSGRTALPALCEVYHPMTCVPVTCSITGYILYFNLHIPTHCSHMIIQSSPWSLMHVTWSRHHQVIWSLMHIIWSSHHTW